MIAVRELHKDDLASAVDVVARGMRDNPIHVAAFGPDEDGRGQRLARMFAVALPLIYTKGTILGAFDGQTLVGIAGMLAPGRCQPSLTEKLALMPRMIPAIGGSTFTRVGQWMGTWARHDLKEPHWHLGPVAVDAPLQRQGIGTRLMLEYCTRIDRERGIGYLETDKAENVAFYERFGFSAVATAPVLDTPNWFMRRPSSGG